MTDNAEPLVKQILTKYPKTKGDDKLLMLKIWHKQGLILTQPQINFFYYKCFSPETIRRERQRIQHEGQLLPEGKILKARKEKEKKMHDRFGHKTFQFDREREIFVEV